MLTRGYFVRSEDGVERPYGKDCIQHEFGIGAHRGIPDLTIRDGAPNSKRNNSRRNDSLHVDHDDTLIAKRYLLLRSRLAELPYADNGLRYQQLADIHAQYVNTGELSASEVNHIVAIERHQRTPHKYKAINLLDVHTALRQIDKKIRNATSDKSVEYLNSIRHGKHGLLPNLRLSQKQIMQTDLKLHKNAFQF
ncbi:hypothetical protein AB7849_15640 [Rhodanobacter sp. 115]|uniref:hypothetical protein n=1 Tax=Rhodanobacter sp. FW021-MT20 TaxID=1162282 RepID=UPI0034E40391